MGSGFSRSYKLQSDEKTVKQRKEKPKHPLENLEELERTEHIKSGDGAEVWDTEENEMFS